MKILICGLPGTGKTTLSKIISEKLNFDILTDWDIFAQNKIIIKEYEDKNKISRQYSKMLLNNISANSNCVVDLEYSISPNDYKKFHVDNKDISIIYLGFLNIDETFLYNLFRKSDSNNKYTNEELMKKIKFYKKISLDYKLQCDKNNLKFFDINKDRKIIFNEILECLNIK